MVAKRAQYFVSDIRGLPVWRDKITISRTQADGISILTNVLYLAHKEFADIICKHSLVKKDWKVQKIRCAK